MLLRSSPSNFLGVTHNAVMKIWCCSILYQQSPGPQCRGHSKASICIIVGPVRWVKSSMLVMWLLPVNVCIKIGCVVFTSTGTGLVWNTPLLNSIIINAGKLLMWELGISRSWRFLQRARATQGGPEDWEYSSARRCSNALDVPNPPNYKLRLRYNLHPTHKASHSAKINSVGRTDFHFYQRTEMTRIHNLDRNLLETLSSYCLSTTLHGGLHMKQTHHHVSSGAYCSSKKYVGGFWLVQYH